MKKIAILPALVIILMISVSAKTQTTQEAERHFEKANELLKRMDYEGAIAEYSKVVNLSSNSKVAQDAQYWIGQSHFRAGRFDAALSMFAELIEEHPKSTIVPVAQIMIAQVRKEKEIQKLRADNDAATDRGFIIDPATGIKYTKTHSFIGKRDVITWDSYLSLSPNGKFLLRHNIVLPLDSGDPFKLVNMNAYSGHWSPEGKKVVFNSEGAIWVVPVSPETGRTTGPARKLLDGNYRYSARKEWWSPDGEKLVFIRKDDEVSGGIWTLSVKDGTLTQIADEPLPESPPIWSSDGKAIVYKKGLETWWKIPVEGGTPAKISRVEAGLLHSPRSPDGKWLFLTGREKLIFFRIVDRRVFEISKPEEVGKFFSTSPDGKKLLFYRKPYDYTCILKVVSTSGGPSFQLGRDLMLWPYVHFWSTDSKMIITRGGYPIEPKYNVDTSFWMVPLGGGNALPLELDVAVIGKPYPRSMSPDCRKLLFAVSQSETTEDLYVTPVSVEDARTTGTAVMVFSGRDKKPVGYGKMDEWAWSADGTKLAVIHGGDIWITSAEEGKPIRITKTPEHEIWPAWSPDGQMIAYMYYRVEEPILHVISVSGGKSTKILDTPAGRDKYAWSPDNKEIAVISNGAISAISIANGKAREILDLKDQGFVDDAASGLSWLPDGKHLAFISHKKREGTQIFMVPAEGGEVTEIAADDESSKDWLYPSPDGKWISYDAEGDVKTRSQGTMWEADFDEILNKVSR
ncbi:MAG TPA: DPP IV N-terminal domain-containing protein [Sedimentisphaerales bacterium]|nr:DPP IV N-terminal domain-containing protein [Sedimentisphaerales bacterium]